MHKKEKKEAENKELEETQAKLREMSENFLRLQAEFANFKKRTDEQRVNIYASATCDTLKEFINVFDDFELALKNTTNLEEFKKGTEMIFAKFITTAEEMGLEKIKTIGEQFNPHEHEALLIEQSDKEENSILEELQSGYKVKNVVIRTAKVKVSKK